MSLKQHIPNAITCCNLLSGCLSILFLTHDMPVKAALMIFAAGLFDFFDGFAARLLNVHSPIGADLDSLSDVVSFGVAPGFIMYWLMSQYFASKLWLHEWWWSVGGFNVLPVVCFLLMGLPIAFHSFYASCILGYTSCQIQCRRHADDLVPWHPRTRNGHFHRLAAIGTQPSRTSHRRRVRLLGLPRHHHYLFLHDDMPIAILLVQDEVSPLER